VPGLPGGDSLAEEPGKDYAHFVQRQPILYNNCTMYKIMKNHINFFWYFTQLLRKSLAKNTTFLVTHYNFLATVEREKEEGGGGGACFSRIYKLQGTSFIEHVWTKIHFVNVSSQRCFPVSMEPFHASYGPRDVEPLHQIVT
jgi:hypothetical protein